MTVRECVNQGRVASEHRVQFFDTDESRAECVSQFLAEGYRAGEPLVVVARPRHWAAMVDHLGRLDVPVQDAMAEGSLIVKDADDMLRHLSRNGSPDEGLFESLVVNTVTRLQRPGSRIRAYGEMVDMLAQRGEMADAIKLETMWNRLGERLSICLLCGYSAAHFVSANTHRALREICSAHTSVHRHEQDPLASWLLTAAHNRLEVSGSSSALQN